MGIETEMQGGRQARGGDWSQGREGGDGTQGVEGGAAHMQQPGFTGQVGNGGQCQQGNQPNIIPT